MWTWLKTHRVPVAFAGVMLLCLVFAPDLLASESGPPGGVGDHHVDGEQSKGAGLLEISGSLMFWEYLTFGLVCILLGIVVVPRLLKQLDARQTRIEDSQDLADRVRAEAEVLLKKHGDLMRSAHDDAKKITDEAATAARDVAAKIRVEAELASVEIKDRANREVDLAMKKAQAELREQAVELALLASSNVLKKSLGDEDHRRLAREAIDAAGTLKN